MKRFASTLAVVTILMSALSTAPATAAVESPTIVEAAAPITAPAAVLTFERIEVVTVAAPVPVYVEPVYVEPETIAPAPAPVYVPAPIEPHGEPAPPICQEDEPCWDCATMGNRICGSLPNEAATRPDHPHMPYTCPADFWLFGDTCVDPATGQPV